MEACLDDLVEVVAVVIRLVCEDMHTNRHGVVDGGADGQGIFSDAQPVQDGLFSPHVTEIAFVPLVQDVDLEVVREEAQEWPPRRHHLCCPGIGTKSAGRASARNHPHCLSAIAAPP